MKFQKILAVFLLVAVLLTLGACGNTDTPPVGNTGNNQENTGTEEWGKFKAATTTKTVLTAENDCTVTIAPVTYTDGFVEFEVTFENKAESMKNLYLTCFSVNGMMINSYLNLDAEAGTSVVDVFDVTEDELRLLGIFQIATVDLLFSISDEDWNVEQTLSCQLKSSAAEQYVADPEAYFTAITNEKAQTEMEYTVLASEKERMALGGNVYLESKVYMDNGGEMLLLEVVNEDDRIRYVQIDATTVNGIDANGAGEEYTILPGARALMVVDMEWGLPQTVRESFGMQEVANMDLHCQVYACEDDGTVSWTDEGEECDFTYTVLDRTVSVDMSGTVLYDENGLKITAKPPVKREFAEDWNETFVYLIFENTGDTDLYITEDYNKDIIVDGYDDNYVYFQDPYHLGAGDMAIRYLEVDDMLGEYAILPLCIKDDEFSDNEQYIELIVDFKE